MGRLFGAEQIREVPLWVGRDQLLDDLRDDLLVRRRKVLVLVGQEGIGKTSLAVKLLEACGVEARTQRLTSACSFARVLYVRVQEGLSFDGVVSELGRGLEVSLSDGMQPGQMIDALIGGLQRSHCLVVLDNLEDVLASGKALSVAWGQLLWALVDRSHDSQVVITSREVPIDLADPRDVSGIPSSVSVRLERVNGIDDDASVELLRKLGLRDSEVDLRWVAGRVAGQVQVLTLLAKWARKPGMLRQRPELVTADAKPILRVQVAKLREAARELLKRMCVLRVGIELEGLTFLRLYQDDESEMGRFWMATKIQIPVEFEISEIDQTQKLVSELVNVSLVDEKYDEKCCADNYRLHRVIAEFMQAEYALELPELIKSAYSFYRSGAELNEPKKLEDLRPLLEAQHFAFQLRNYSEAWSLVSWELGKYLSPWGHWTLLQNLLEEILPHVQDTDKGRCIELIGIIERDRGNWDAAERLFRQSLKVEEELGDRSGMATSWGVLGDIERDRGNWDAAERLYRQSLKVEEELGDRSGMATSWGVLGDIERNRGNWDAAERLYRQSLKLREELGDRSGMAWITSDRGANELGRGNLDLAKSLLLESLNQSQSLEMKDLMAETNGHLAQLYHAKNNPELAQQHYTIAHQLFTQLGALKDIETLELGMKN